MRWLAATLAALLLGAVLKGIAVPAGAAAGDPAARFGALRRPWGPRAAVQVYFPDASGRWLVQVTRAAAAATPEAALAELLAGPPAGGPRPALPPGWRLAGLRVSGSAAEVALASGAPGAATTDAPAGQGGTVAPGPGGPWAAAVAATVRAAAPEVAAVTVAVDGGRAVRVTDADLRRLNGGRPAGPGEAPVTLYYLVDGRPLPVQSALPAGPDLPARAVQALLAGPAPAGLAWLPPGVSLDGFALRRGVAHVRLRLSPDLAALVEAGAWNFAPYYMAVVYTLTDFPGIRKVQFEFAGLTALALRQCRTPLSVPLVRPGPEAGRSEGGSARGPGA